GVGGMVSVMHRRTVYDLRAIADGQVVRHRDGLAMRDAEAMEVPCPRCPRAHARSGAWLHEINGGHAAEVVALAVAGEITLVSSPAHLARLTALAHEAVDRPGVDELAGLLGHARALGVALGDVNDLHTELTGELAPVGPRGGLAGIHLGVGGNVEQRLLDEM